MTTSSQNDSNVVFAKIGDTYGPAIVAKLKPLFQSKPDLPTPFVVIEYNDEWFLYGSVRR